MKLAYSAASPYVLKVNACAIARGIDGKIERWKVGTTDPALLDFNPLSKVPTLITDDGTMLYDSPVICEYIDSIGSAPKLFPPAGAARPVARRPGTHGGRDAAAPARYPPAAGRRPQGLYRAAAGQGETRAGRAREGSRFARHADHDRRDHHRLRARLPRFPLRQRALAARPSQARGLVRQGREAAAACRDRAGGMKVRILEEGRKQCRHARARNS